MLQSLGHNVVEECSLFWLEEGNAQLVCKGSKNRHAVDYKASNVPAIAKKYNIMSVRYLSKWLPLVDLPSEHHPSIFNKLWLLVSFCFEGT